MSLLLDALKRAEDAKRAKADAAAAPSPGSDAHANAATPATEPIPAITPAAAAFPELTLEEVDSRPPDPVASAPTNPVSTSVPTLEAATESALTLEAVLSGGVETSTAPTTPRATAAFRAARSNHAQQDVPPTPPPASSKPSVSVAPSEHDAATAPEAAAQLASNREAVKNAFAVKQTNKAPSKNTIAMIAIGALVSVVLGGGWYVWMEMNRVTRPVMARTPPTPLPQKPVADPGPSANTTASATPTPRTEAVTDTSGSAASGGKAARDPEAALPPLLPPPALEIAVPKTVATTKTVAVSPREAVAKRVEALPEAALTPPAAGSVKLKLANPGVSSIDPVLAAGYAALTAGDYPSAQKHYAEVVRQSPSSIDAHLGLATAAARTGTPASLSLAGRHYGRVLELDPRNSTALTGLMALAVDSVAGAAPDRTRWDQREGELTRLIAADPQSATPHYLLGNLYAEQRRWSEAQLSFFEAARLAPENGDYAYNLAISLDHLGQSRNALTFYRRALAATSKSQFDKSVVERRIAKLTTASEASPGR